MTSKQEVVHQLQIHSAVFIELIRERKYEEASNEWLICKTFLDLLKEIPGTQTLAGGENASDGTAPNGGNAPDGTTLVAKIS